MHQYINIHTHSFSSNSEEVAIYNVDFDYFLKWESSNPPVFPTYHSTGIHPWYIDTIDIPEHLNILENLIHEKQICAVGEIGLDKVCKTDFKIQREVFILQLEIASKYDLPVIIHCVKAYNEVVEILVELKHNAPVIFHGFNSSMQMAQLLINKGYFLSFGPEILNPKSKRREIIKNIPLNRMFLETDDTKINICQLYKEASKLLSVIEVDLRQEIELNFKRVLDSVCE